MENKIIPNNKPIKIANNIVIGGMIALGKTTLSQYLHSIIKPSNVIFELHEDDKLMSYLLEKMYERNNDKLYGSLFQHYFILNRFENYKKNANNKDLTIFDRSIFEDWLFARENINNPSIFNFYNSLWESICNEVNYLLGVPKLYVILDANWEVFKERLFLRNRKVETDNFNKNEDYFKHLHKIYKQFLVDVCCKYGINYLVVDACLSTEKQAKIIIDELNKINKD